MSMTSSICRPLTRAIGEAGGGGFVSIVANGVLAPFVTFTRTSTATYYGSDGLLKTAAINEPRVDYDPATLALRGLLVEEQRTNLLLRSQEFDNASWGKVRCTVSANATTGPDGSLTADKIIEDTSNNSHTVLQSGPSMVLGSVYTYSCYFKAAERTRAQLSSANGAPFCTFDLSAGTVVSGAGAAIQSVGNGWYRCSVTYTSTATATETVYIWLVASGTTNSYLGNGTSGVYVWGAQLEAGNFATSYIPTTSAAVTRAVDDPDFTIPSGIVRLEYTYDDDTTADVAVTPGAAYQIPTSQKRVKFLRGYRL